MCKSSLFLVLFLLSSALWAQELPDTQSLQTPKQKALQLLNDLDNLNNQQLQNSEDLQTQLDSSSQQVAQLKTTLKEVVSSSTDLEKSLIFSQTLNDIVVPAGGIALLAAIIEGIILVVKK